MLLLCLEDWQSSKSLGKLTFIVIVLIIKSLSDEKVGVCRSSAFTSTDILIQRTTKGFGLF